METPYKKKKKKQPLSFAASQFIGLFILSRVPLGNLRATIFVYISLCILSFAFGSGLNLDTEYTYDEISLLQERKRSHNCPSCREFVWLA